MKNKENQEKSESDSPTHEKKPANGNKLDLAQLLVQKETTIADYINDLKRLQAEFENYQKRMEREQEEFRRHANALLLREFLSLQDALQAGLEKMEHGDHGHEQSKEKMKEGLKMLEKQFTEFLTKHKVTLIKSKDLQFDPSLHEVVQKGHDKGKPEDRILEEFQKGYLLDDKVLRSAKVKVNKLDD